jgi:uroporphyrinogen decarboxylase
MPDPNFKRLRQALMLEGEPDRVPMVDFWISKHVVEGVLGRPVKTLDDHFEFYYKAGYDFVKLQASINLNPAGIKPNQEANKGTGMGGGDWAPEGKGIITNWEEYERYVWPGPNDISLKSFEEAHGKIPQGMGVIAEYGHIFHFAWKLMGLETFCIALHTDTELVETIWRRAGEMAINVIQKMLDYDFVDAILYKDDIAFGTSLFVAPDVLRKYQFPWMKQIGDMAKQRNVPLIYHADGTLWEVIDDIVACGVNALHPIEALAMDIREVKERYGNKLCLIGNLDLAGPLVRGTPQEVEEEVKWRMRDIAPGGGYCLGSGNAVTYYVPFDNYKAMMQAGEKYGRYPIQL